MNINQAKEYIKNDIRMYLKKDEFGDYRIPVVRQRPVFLLGAPGIGKTAIMEQIAQELNLALVSYSMTHHTRQSALGLPFIKQKSYDDLKYDVSEYTMSEIISTIYDTMEQSGVREGILFLDEINCVSETLAPSMLQFLQYKVFGRHKVPEGWVVVTAGNPPLYNKSVREFDVVTLDRLKVIEVEADYDTWRKYAVERSVHPSIISFLDIKKDFFYHMETVAGGRSYVTARGWEDVSEMIKLYEEDGLDVDETLVGQYLRNDKIVREFTAYYDLFNRYKNDYRVDAILAGDISDTAVERAKQAPFDERLSLLSLLTDKVETDMKETVTRSDYLKLLMPGLKSIKEKSEQGGSVKDEVSKLCGAYETALKSREAAGALSREEKKKYKRAIAFLDKVSKELDSNVAGSDASADFVILNAAFDNEVSAMRELSVKTGDKLKNLFAYAERAFEDGNELLILVTELTVNSYSAEFISMFKSEDYTRLSALLMVTQRAGSLKEEILGE